MRENRATPPYAVAALLASAIAALAGEAADPSPRGRAAPEQIAAWIAGLNADEYGVREEATGRLVAAGAPAIGPVAQAVAAGNWELATRGVFILQELAVCSDAATEQEALTALEKIAGTQRSVAARRAVEALAKLDQLRQQRALEVFRRLGAKTDPEYEEKDLFHGTVFAIEFGDEWRGGESDLRRLRWLREVQQVTFTGPRVTDAWLAHLVGMESLRIVKIKRAQLSDDGMECLRRLETLRCVKLLYVPIGDRAVRHLKECRHILRMKIFGSKISDQGAKELVAALGAAVVDCRKGAFLGIGNSELGENWCISWVTEGSAAEKAGLRPGDVITKYGDQPVRDFESLTRLIGQNNPGDTVTVEVRRQGQTLVKQITFGEWE